MRAIDGLVDEERFGRDAVSIYRDARATRVHSQLQLLRLYRPGRWRPETQVEGQERLEAALARGRGVVLWLPISAGYALGAKVALDTAGFGVNHLSHPRHGFSKTRFGTRVLNPICTRVEDRYLRSRIMLSWQGPAEALRESRRRLGANEIVSITAGGSARNPTTVPFLGGDLQIAGGAPGLVFSADAVLLPIFPTIEEDGHGRGSRSSRRCRKGTASPRRNSLRAVLSASAQLLEGEVRRRPEQWLGWAFVEPTGGRVDGAAIRYS